MKLSYDHKLLLFKHSTRCSISSMAKNRIEVVNQSKIKNCFLLDLISYREIYDKIETIFLQVFGFFSKPIMQYVKIIASYE